MASQDGNDEQLSTTQDGPREESRYPRPPVTLDEAERVWRELAAEAMRPDAKPEIARLAVITGLVRATGARYGDLLRIRVEDLDLGPDAARAGEGVATVRHGKHRVLRRHRLPTDLVVLLRHWMSVREDLAAELEGTAPRALLLTVHHTHDNGTTVASGLPITRQGLVLSWRRFVHRTNARYGATRPPLPTRFEQVRRAWTEAGAGEEA
ncbi:tyrosine-type recombinase/integrase [Myceligenerans indicum]|uniref:Phage integrase family protein n=1 Tax=Myceligenerans indicum TaxID=2593663 RepID=A0ABS1LQS7_9MICO|nr:tyrosine-type recombinase/integrase [Myceligenerans indicum]MBL0888646.1 phage integrase family protein [Myceligenerans indicum]